MPVVWYRYEDHYWDEDDLRIQLKEFNVVKHTPKGVWLRTDNWPRPRRLVLNGSRRQYACPTKEQALVSFLARKRKQRALNQAAVERAGLAIRIVEQDAKDGNGLDIRRALL